MSNTATYHPALDVRSEKNARGYTDYTYSAPFSLKDQLGAAYEQAKAEGKKVFRKFNPETKRWTGNEVWLEIINAIVVANPPQERRVERKNLFQGAPAAREDVVSQPIPPATVKAVAKELTQLASRLSTLITQEIDGREALGDGVPPELAMHKAKVDSFMSYVNREIVLK